MNELHKYILDKLVWASSHRNCEPGAHDNLFRSEYSKELWKLPCPTERMFKLWYTTLIESKVMTQGNIEKYLEEKKKKK